RDVLWQAAVLVGIVALLAFFVRNASENMLQAGIASGFDFLERTSGIDLPFVLTAYTAQSSLLALMWTGIANTLPVSAGPLGAGRRPHACRDRAAGRPCRLGAPAARS